MQATFSSVMQSMTRIGRKFGPYVLLEIILPGGTLMALLLFLYQSGRLNFVHDVPRVARAATDAIVSALEQSSLVLQPCYSWVHPTAHTARGGSVGAYGMLTVV